MPTVHSRTYIIALISTVIVFAAALSTSSVINRHKTNQLKAAEDQIAIDILSLETQSGLIGQTSCQLFASSTIDKKLDDLATRLRFMEAQVGADDPELFRIKRYYPLLQIQDYLLRQKYSERCRMPAIFILYFYSEKDCDECDTQNYILRAVKERYPQISVYSFDYNLDLPAIQTLVALHNVPQSPPIIDINGKLYKPFKSLEDIEETLAPLLASTTKARATISSSTPITPSTPPAPSQ